VVPVSSKLRGEEEVSDTIEYRQFMGRRTRPNSETGIIIWLVLPPLQNYAFEQQLQDPDMEVKKF
jgi:hypothetical protein